MSELTSKQLEQIDGFEGEVEAMVESVLGIQLDRTEVDTTDEIRTIMDLVAQIGEKYGIPEMETYPYLDE